MPYFYDIHRKIKNLQIIAQNRKNYKVNKSVEMKENHGAKKILQKTKIQILNQ